MFAKASLLAALVPLATALTLNVPTGTIQAGNTVNISWTSSSGDPSSFTLELVNGPVLHDTLGISNNVQTSSGSVQITLPIVAADSAYTIEAVNIGNISDVFSTTGPFSIEAASTSASLSVASSSSVATASSSATNATSAASAASSGTASPSSAANGRTSSFVSAASSALSSATSAAAASSSVGTSFNHAAGLSVPAGMVAAGAMGVVALVAGFAF